MDLGIVSDTHDNLDVVEAAVDVFAGSVDIVVHCGDIVAPFAATPFDADFDFYAVRGNNDGEWALRETVESFGTYFGEFGELELDGCSIAFYHGTSLELVDALVRSGTYDYVCHGHTHEQVHEASNGTVRLNPGGIPIDVDADAEPPAAVILDTDSGAVDFHDLR
ncbi:MAG: metallophosphoesterase [Salinirussus sp.]